MPINANKCCSADVHLFFKKLVNDIIYMQEIIYHKFGLISIGVF
ncbi:hypothetical protein [Salmonella phage SD-2_S15]|nr:hypothetical protein [Salmonella phage SD-2_S15]